MINRNLEERIVFFPESLLETMHTIDFDVLREEKGVTYVLQVDQSRADAATIPALNSPAFKPIYFRFFREVEYDPISYLQRHLEEADFLEYSD